MNSLLLCCFIPIPAKLENCFDNNIRLILTATRTFTTKMSMQSSDLYCINFQDVQQAAERIKGVAYRTPVLTSTSINRYYHDCCHHQPNNNNNDSSTEIKNQHVNETIGSPRHFYFKVEAMQRTGSFKFRGALNAIRSILEEDEENNHADDGGDTHPTTATTTHTIQPQQQQRQLQVVTHSSGNHAQALALAAKLSCTDTKSVVVTIVMPESTPSVKKNAVLAFGGIPVMTANTNIARESEAERIRRTTGATFIHPSEDPRVIAGQGTVCYEFIQQIQEMGVTTSLDAVIIPVGGGGLAAGNAITLRALLGKKVKIILAEPECMDDAKRSFDSKTLLQHHPDNPLQSADGLKTTLGPNTWPIVRDLVDDIMTVSELEIITATKLIWERLKVCIEPSAGVGVAVALSKAFQDKYDTMTIQHVGIILCGGNVDVVQLSLKMHEMGV
jgi:serine racemase